MNRNIKPGDPENEYAERMRAACPIPGTDWFQFMAVEMQPGENIKAHQHRQHLVLYYPEAAGPVIVHPQAGTMLYLPIDTRHEVPPVKSARLSIAMLIEEPKCK